MVFLWLYGVSLLILLMCLFFFFFFLQAGRQRKRAGGMDNVDLELAEKKVAETRMQKQSPGTRNGYKNHQANFVLWIWEQDSRLLNREWVCLVLAEAGADPLAAADPVPNAPKLDSELGRKVLVAMRERCLHYDRKVSPLLLDDWKNEQVVDPHV